jgi:hypothetical protein
MWHDRYMRPIVPRLFAALPDALTAAVFFIARVAPVLAAPDRVTRAVSAVERQMEKP